MPKLVVSMGDPDSFTTGLSKDQMKTITWADFTNEKVGGGKRAMVIADMLKYRLPAQVRLADDRFNRADTNVPAINITYGYDEHRITEDWTDVGADFAYQLWTDSKEQVRYGAPTYAVEWQDQIDENGQSVRVRVAVSVEGVQMFDFRFKHEGDLVVAAR